MFLLASALTANLTPKFQPPGTCSAGFASQGDVGLASEPVQSRDIGSGTESIGTYQQVKHVPAPQLTETEPESVGTDDQKKGGSASPPLEQVDFSNASKGGNEETIFRTDATAYWYGAIPDAIDRKNPVDSSGGLRRSGPPKWNVRGKGVLRVL